MRMLHWNILIVIGLLSTSCGVLKPSPEKKNLKLITKWMTGDFSSNEQYKDNPEQFHDIRVHIRQVWPQDTSGNYLYVEQCLFSDGKERAPFRQRVYKLDTENPGGRITCEIFLIEGLENLPPFNYKSLGALSRLNPHNDLNLAEGCKIYFSRSRSAKKDTPFKGRMAKRKCLNQYEGASYVNAASIEVGKSMIKSKDQGKKNNGEHVWGSPRKPYIFLRE